MERNAVGSLLDEVVCTKCNPGMEPSSSQTICTRCKQSIYSNLPRCTCDEGQFNVGGICGKDVLKNWPDERRTYTMIYENGKEVDSQFLRSNLLRGVFFCKVGKFNFILMSLSAILRSA